MTSGILHHGGSRPKVIAATAGFVLYLLITAGPCVALDLFVDASNGDDSGDGLSWGTAKASIGSALEEAAASVEADTV